MIPEKTRRMLGADGDAMHITTHRYAAMKFAIVVIIVELGGIRDDKGNIIDTFSNGRCERPFAWCGNGSPLRTQMAKRLAYRFTGYAEFFGKRMLGWKPLAGLII